MRLDESLSWVAAFPRDHEFQDLRRNIDPEWVEQALAATGTATVRRRRLPAEQVVWVVIGMALMRNRSIHDVVSKLALVLPGASPTVVPSAVADARGRLGAEPLEWLFTRCADEWAHASAREHAWRGLALYGIDGTTVRVPDSTENRSEFGAQPGGERGATGYPQVRLVALMALRSHLLAGAAMGPYLDGEPTQAAGIWPLIPAASLTVVDRGLGYGAAMVGVERGGANRHWLTRAKSNARWTVVEHLCPNQDLVEIPVSPQAREKDPTLPPNFRARMIRYRQKGSDPQVLLTSLLDEKLYPAAEIVALYHERWELELGYDELKTEMLDREEAIRSRKPAGVRQELWGLLLAYNLVRVEMERTAREAKVPPTRISFVGAMRMICDEWLWCAIAQPGVIPKHLRNLRKNLVGLVLPPRRDRTYPRAVKVKMSNYPRNRRSARG